MWWPGGKTAGKRLEAVQNRLGRRLLGASRTVAGEAIRGEMGWRKLEELKKRGEEDAVRVEVLGAR